MLQNTSSWVPRKLHLKIICVYTEYRQASKSAQIQDKFVVKKGAKLKNNVDKSCLKNSVLGHLFVGPSVPQTMNFSKIKWLRGYGPSYLFFVDPLHPSISIRGFIHLPVHWYIYHSVSHFIFLSFQLNPNSHKFPHIPPEYQKKIWSKKS